ncbi:hypothetical protein FQA47_025087 [Oryzias melastigma]|uniref:Uncharacterized protein n=1 Tax=Oryzias melastigma TaxID=30732 RepID=A0A834CRL5_ORYME|nr:hypothetical protein FQA47_025087 [Oryzias melastigma]
MQPHTSQRTCQLLGSSVVPEQYMVQPLFMLKLYTWRPLLYFCVIVVVAVDGVLYVKTYIKSNVITVPHYSSLGAHQMFPELPNYGNRGHLCPLLECKVQPQHKFCSNIYHRKSR